jgi:hypothetical protein
MKWALILIAYATSGPPAGPPGPVALQNPLIVGTFPGMQECLDAADAAKGAKTKAFPYEITGAAFTCIRSQ